MDGCGRRQRTIRECLLVLSGVPLHRYVGEKGKPVFARASAACSAESVALVAQGYIGKYLGAPYRSHYFSPAVCARGITPTFGA